MPAYICYYPFNLRSELTESYSCYQIEQAEYEDDDEHLIIFPEIYTEQLFKVKNAAVGIWWLSLDNFLMKNYRKDDNFLRHTVRYFRSALRGSRPLLGVKGLKHAIHFSQSHYVSSYLASRGIKSNLLFEPINNQFLDLSYTSSTQPRENVILYNPTKGLHVTEKLIDLFPNFKFIPLKGFTRDGLIERMKSSKIYIDFGHHPGRDRMPREAAMLGACVIVSRQGSAAFFEDVPLPDKFKLDTKSNRFEDQFQNLVLEIFNSYEKVNAELSSYRDHLISEPKIFVNHIKEYFLVK